MVAGPFPHDNKFSQDCLSAQFGTTLKISNPNRHESACPKQAGGLSRGGRVANAARWPRRCPWGSRGMCSCSLNASLQPQSLSPSPPHPSASHPLFKPVLKGSKMVTRFKAEASKMLHKGRTKACGGRSLIQHCSWQCSPERGCGLNPLPMPGFSGRAGGCRGLSPLPGPPEPSGASVPAGAGTGGGLEAARQSGSPCPSSQGWCGSCGGRRWDAGS